MKKHLARYLLGAACVLVFLGHGARVWQLPFVSLLDAYLYDVRVRLSAPGTQDDRIVIVDIDEKSLSEVGRWPWGRDVLAQLVKKLTDEYRVSVLGFDVVFAEPDESSGLKVLEKLGREQLRQRQAEQGVLTSLDTTRFPNGNYRLRLRVVHKGLNYDEYFTPITINNPNAPAALEVPALGDAPAPTPTPAPSNEPLGQGVPDGRRWIEVDISDQTLTAWQGDTVVLKTQVSTGKPGYETVTGTFYVNTKLRYAHMIGPDYNTPDVPWTMYYYQGFAVHGAYWHNNFGRPVSHGCVNMRVNESKLLFEWASIGTEVVVHD